MTESENRIMEANIALDDIIENPVAEVHATGPEPEDTSSIINFEQISETQRLYSKDQLREAYKTGKQEVQNQ